jgi:four helix bundle protein
LYALTSQIQRAVVSIPTKIAEGCGKDSDAELGRYLKIAMGSSNE